MSKPHEIVKDEAARPVRRRRTVHSAVIVHDGNVVMNEVFESAHDRRDAIVEHLRVNHDEVESDVPVRVLDRFGGASPDEAVLTVFACYEDAVNEQLLLDLAESEIDDGPAWLYGTLTDYGDGTVAAEAQGSEQGRADALRERVSMFYEDLVGEPLPDDADEAFLSRVMNTLFLDPARGRLYLFEMQRNDEGLEWRSEIS